MDTTSLLMWLTSLSLHSLPQDFFGNNFVKIKAAWFGPWAKNLIRLAMFNNAISEIEDGVFDNMDSLEMAYFHCTNLTSLPPAMVQQLLEKPSFAHLTINDNECSNSEPFTWQSDNPPPYPVYASAIASAGVESVETAPWEVDCTNVKWNNQAKCEDRSEGACTWVDDACVPVP